MALLTDGPNTIKKKARYERRLRNITRRMEQLEEDFTAADSIEAELRVNEQINRQRGYYLRTLRRLGRKIYG